MDTDSRYPLESKFIFDGQMVWFYMYSNTEMDMVRRNLTEEEKEAHKNTVNFSEV